MNDSLFTCHGWFVSVRRRRCAAGFTSTGQTENPCSRSPAPSLRLSSLAETWSCQTNRWVRGSPTTSAISRRRSKVIRVPYILLTIAKISVKAHRDGVFTSNIFRTNFVGAIANFPLCLGIWQATRSFAFYFRYWKNGNGKYGKHGTRRKQETIVYYDSMALFDMSEQCRRATWHSDN